MATLAQLARPKGDLKWISPPSGTVGTGRPLYFTARFIHWAAHNLPLIPSTFWGGDVPALAQAKEILRRFSAGEVLRYDQDLGDLEPSTDAVWELKTGDVRIFGWFPAFDTFVATGGADAHWLKQDRAHYDMHVDRCSLFRRGLNLDEPKALLSRNPRDVISF